MERVFAYPARFEADEAGRILVTFPDLPGVATDGADETEAMVRASDALSVGLSERIARGEELPPASDVGRRMQLVWPSVFATAKIALNIAFKENGTSISALARTLEIDPKEVRRLLDPREPSKLVRMEQALIALGYRLTASAERAADRPRATTKAKKRGKLPAPARAHRRAKRVA